MVRKSQIEATTRYNEKTYDRLYIRVKKGKKELLELKAKELGKSVNELINEAIDTLL